MNENTGVLPVFYTRNHVDYKGTKIALWESSKSVVPGEKQHQYDGKIGDANVKLWKMKGGSGVFFNIKQEVAGQMLALGTACAYSAKGFNTLSISLRFDSLETANKTKEALGIKEHPKPWKELFFINIFADVSIKAVEAKPEDFAAMGFLIGNAAIRKKSPRP